MMKLFSNLHRIDSGAFELVTNCNQLKMQAADGKFYLTDVADTAYLLKNCAAQY